jgi:hypothetical protein
MCPLRWTFEMWSNNQLVAFTSAIVGPQCID